MGFAKYNFRQPGGWDIEVLSHLYGLMGLPIKELPERILSINSRDMDGSISQLPLTMPDPFAPESLTKVTWNVSSSSFAEQNKDKFMLGEVLLTKWGDTVTVEDINHASPFPYYVASAVGGYWTSYEELSRPGVPVPGAPCRHAWAKYVGFTDTYEYCTACDEKRR